MGMQLHEISDIYPDFYESGKKKNKQAVRYAQEPYDHTGSI